MKFSIIVPVYNACLFLHICIASVAAQSVNDWELILIDDGSTDGSAEILDAYAEADSRICVIHQENRGQFFARQSGIYYARGEYLVFLDSDDEITPECLEILQTEISKEVPDIIMYTGKVIRNDSDAGRIIGRMTEKRQRISVEMVKENLLACNDMNSLYLKAFRRELFLGDDTDYSSLEGMHCGEDKVQLLYPLTHATNILYIPDCLYRYYHRVDSIMHRFEINRITALMAGEMFSILRFYMEKWNMNDRHHQEQLALYQIRTYLSVYFGVRKRCTTFDEKRAFRRYPWNQYTESLTVWCRLAKRKLGFKERVMLIVTKMRL